VKLGTGTEWKVHAFGVEGEPREFLALVLGEVDKSPTLVRVHTGSMLGDIFGVHGGQRVLASEAIQRIEREGRGVFLFLPGRVGVRNDLAYHLGEPVSTPMDTGEVLVEVGLGKVRLLTNRPRRIAGLEGYGLEVVEQILIDESLSGASFD
jgi:3,4-dihydroxy 2-butanone 4-phosphate synthase/GTP cyclohydrolase II